jgi:excisionase family DNA binding protein
VSTAATALSKRFLTATDVAGAIHAKEPVVYDLIKSGHLRARRVGRRWLIDPDSLTDFMAGRVSGAPAETVDPAAGSTRVDPEWVAAQVAKFSADDLRRAGELLLALSRANFLSDGAA